jgi:hypothetical protein
MKQLRFLFFVLIVGGLHMACNDPTIVGSDLLNEEGLNIDFSDSINLHMRTVAGEPISTLVSGSATQLTYMIGELNDPFFGYSKTSSISEVHLGNSTPDFENSVLDSAVLVIAYDSLAFYGDKSQAFDIKVYQLSQSLVDIDSLRSDETIAHESIPLGELNSYVVNTVDSVNVFDPDLDSTVLIGAHLRIPIDYNWADQILMDTTAAKSDSALVELVKGLYVEATSNGDGGYIGLGIGSNADQTELVLYYTQSDTLKTKYKYRVLGKRHIEIQHDYSGTPVEEVLDDFTMGDSLLYIQSLAGVNIELDFSEIESLGDVLINKAELELVVAELPGDDLQLYPPINNFIASKADENGELTLIDDLSTALNLGNLELYFGGLLTEEELEGITVQKYNFNLTNFAINALAGKENPTMTISAAIKSERPNRSIIFGPGHSKYPARLKLTYTSLK